MRLDEIEVEVENNKLQFKNYKVVTSEVISCCEVTLINGGSFVDSEWIKEEDMGGVLYQKTSEIEIEKHQTVLFKVVSLQFERYYIARNGLKIEVRKIAEIFTAAPDFQSEISGVFCRDEVFFNHFIEMAKEMIENEF